MQSEPSLDSMSLASDSHTHTYIYVIPQRATQLLLWLFICMWVCNIWFIPRHIQIYVYKRNYIQKNIYLHSYTKTDRQTDRRRVGHLQHYTLTIYKLPQQEQTCIHISNVIIRRKFNYITLYLVRFSAANDTFMYTYVCMYVWMHLVSK